MYQLVHGKHEEAVGHHVRIGVLPRLPDRIANAPTLGPFQEVYWQAFQDLTSSRSTGFSVGYIPWGAMRDYVQWHDFDKETAEDFFLILRIMDRAYVEWCEKQRKDSK